MSSDKLEHRKVELSHKQADGYVIHLGPVNLVSVITEVGMVACGAFNIAIFDNFKYPAVCVCSSEGKSIITIDDLLQGVVKEINASAEKIGIKPGMSGKDALEKM